MSLNNQRVFSLQEVAQSIHKTIAARYTSSFWVKAEMNKLNHYPHSGHCYPELVEKSEGKITAQMRANLWKGDFERINAHFLKVLKEPLKDGIHILFSATVQFDPVYGLSLRIHDIDPSFSLGELEREKMATIERLKGERVFDANKSLHIPLLPQRIAVISVETSKGYADFKKVIDGNPWGYKFFHMLFPALLQGDKADASILEQLRLIERVRSHFDAVTIIRGGGGDVGLSCYNHYELSHRVATFPLPVISGIGHSTNETVVEMVAFKNAITPTEVADLLIQAFHNFSVPVKESAKALQHMAPAFLEQSASDFSHLSHRFQQYSLGALRSANIELSNASLHFQRATRHKITLKRNQLSEAKARTAISSLNIFKKEKRELLFGHSRMTPAVTRLQRKFINDLEIAEKAVVLMDPLRVLQRGYSITYTEGKVIKSVDEVKPGTKVETQFSDGKIISTVEGKAKK